MFTKDDVLKLKALVSLLENHATYGNMNLAQVGAFKAVIDYAKSLPGKAEEFLAKPAPAPVEPKEPTFHEMRKKLKDMGYRVYKVSDQDEEA